jgi:hypothetical protein
MLGFFCAAPNCQPILSPRRIENRRAALWRPEYRPRSSSNSSGDSSGACRTPLFLQNRAQATESRALDFRSLEKDRAKSVQAAENRKISSRSCARRSARWPASGAWRGVVASVTAEATTKMLTCQLLLLYSTSFECSTVVETCGAFERPMPLL